MRIIKQGSLKTTKKTTPVSVSCPICGFEAELDPGEDVTRCPCCGSLNMVFTTPLVAFKTKKKSPSEMFPDEYYHFVADKKNGAVEVSASDTAKMIEDTVARYKNSDGGYAFSSTGDTFVAAFQTEANKPDSFLVVVSKDHYECDFYE